VASGVIWSRIQRTDRNRVSSMPDRQNGGPVRQPSSRASGEPPAEAVHRHQTPIITRPRICRPAGRTPPLCSAHISTILARRPSPAQSNNRTRSHRSKSELRPPRFTAATTRHSFYSPRVARCVHRKADVRRTLRGERSDLQLRGELCRDARSHIDRGERRGVRAWARTATNRQA
jgi:hypothetical protein